MYKDFRHYSKTQSPAAGGLWAWMGADGTRVVNLFTQEPAPAGGGRPGRATLQHVGHALRALARLIVAEKWPTLALPRLATGVGGLQWSEVEPLVRQHLADAPAQVFVYTNYRANQAANEGL